MDVFWTSKVSFIYSSYTLSLTLPPEQEEVIDRLRKQNEDSNSIYYTGLQVIIGLSLLMCVPYFILV